ncbi:DUF1647 domain-containing protein [Reichenbachiella ulvae]|nr:DUF1647 domain-containing protein [Reichenbachiella ulvae]
MERSHNMPNNNYIVSAANSRYYKNFCQLMHSFNKLKEYQNSRVILYDLGLSESEAEIIQNKEIALFEYVEYRKFKFEEYPEFVRPQFNTYSWKPIIIHTVAKEIKASFLWMDSANCILKNLNPIWSEIESTYSYAPISGSGTLKDWTVQETLDYLNVPKKFYNQPNRAGNTFGFFSGSEAIMRLLDRWESFALIKECIRPEGANRSNHRDDQSLLTILLLESQSSKELNLTRDRVNISASLPTPYISVRNIFPKWINLKVGEVAHYYFFWLRFLDMLINKLKGN